MVSDEQWEAADYAELQSFCFAHCLKGPGSRLHPLWRTACQLRVHGKEEREAFRLCQPGPFHRVL